MAWSTFFCKLRHLTRCGVCVCECVCECACARARTRVCVCVCVCVCLCVCGVFCCCCHAFFFSLLFSSFFFSSPFWNWINCWVKSQARTLPVLPTILQLSNRTHVVQLLTRGVTVWNGLPQETVEASLFKTFITWVSPPPLYSPPEYF